MAHLAAGFGNHPVTDAADQAAFFGQRDESIGTEQALRRMMPADQCLDTDDPSPPPADLRLEMQFELATFLEGVAQIVFQ